MSTKQTETLKDFTNKELFEELKSRGFWTMAKELNDETIPNEIVVSVNQPTSKVMVTFDPNYDESNTGSGSTGR